MTREELVTFRKSKIVLKSVTVRGCKPAAS